MEERIIELGKLVDATKAEASRLHKESENSNKIRKISELERISENLSKEVIDQAQASVFLQNQAHHSIKWDPPSLQRFRRVRL